MKKRLERGIFAILPRRCAYCGKVIAADKLSCEKCAADLPRIEGTVCSGCGRAKDECSCRGAERYYTALAAPFYFEGNVRKGIHAFKFRNGRRNREAYCIEMKACIESRFPGVRFDYVISVPMTKKRLRERGYDQSGALAAGLAEMLASEYYPDAVKKIYETEKQHGLSYIFRKGNLAGVFDVTDPSRIQGKTVLLCDDVSTSGETLDECAKMLWLGGAEKIYCAAVALTKMKKNR